MLSRGEDICPPPPCTGPTTPQQCCVAGEGQAATLLHIATISGVLACLMRHFRASLASLPLLAQPISALPVGTWSPTSATHMHEHGNHTTHQQVSFRHQPSTLYPVR